MKKAKAEKPTAKCATAGCEKPGQHPYQQTPLKPYTKAKFFKDALFCDDCFKKITKK